MDTVVLVPHSNRFFYITLSLSIQSILQNVFFICLMAVMGLFCTTPVLGQQNESSTDDLVRRVRFSGNNEIKDRTLETLVRTRTNREFLSIPGFTPWYYIWRISDGRFGEDPVYLNPQTVANDMERIALYYESQGFLDVEVDTTIVEYRTDRVEVSFIIDEGAAYYVDTLSYSGIPEFYEEGMKSDFMESSPLTKKRINDSTFTAGWQYSTERLSTEQQRIISFLKNNGYASVQRDSVIALVKADTAGNANRLAVQYRINAGETYRFGDIRVRLADTEPPDTYSQRDTLIGPPHTRDSTNTIYLAKEPGAQSTFNLLSSQLLFRPGDLYNHSLYLETVNEFQNLGMLYIQRFSQNENQSSPDFSREEIPSYFDLRTLTKHSISTELFGMKRYGFGTGFGVDYKNNNVFGNAENLTIGANASFEFVSPSVLEEIDTTATQSSIFRSYELRGEYSVPRLNFPFSALDNQPGFTSGITRYLLSYSRSDQLLFDINSDVRFNMRYEVNHTPKFSSFLDLLELDIVDTNPSDAYIRNLRNEFGTDTLQDGTIVDAFELQRILEDFNPQVSSIIRYTVRLQDTDLIKRNQGYYGEFAFSIGGNIPYLADRYIFSPDTLEGNLPSLFNLSENSLRYSRFLKLSADYRRYIPLSPSSVFAWRVFGGYAHPYGNSNSIPLNRRFFAGGSNDIRGWGPFQLGPGEIATDNVNIPGGEIKLAAFAETRRIFIQNFLGANWHFALFADAGNIWYGPKNDFRDENNQDRLEQGRFRFDNFYKQIAVSGGPGIRLDWEYVVVRFDFPFRLHDLQRGWFENKQMYFSFGIGHSF
ncbi:BamA/TamA family outer membrane protein [Gracilimonas mengyeensis]|uniref:Outer membrane protein assembly factor BamA n=1 Tax=Gracilimonas mengyeensis TaxID=1302730 RepID=A0A521F085_9BACT|nr:BamA/TamA family outer membrane protein [Gracilimonas mengyeensis]SMO89565.1 Outer membrane protein assembly factor BamA [Gracilimonas mengyeensis]